MSLFWIILSILPRAECLEYIPCVPKSEQRLNLVEIRGYYVYLCSGMRSIEHTLRCYLQ